MSLQLALFAVRPLATPGIQCRQYICCRSRTRQQHALGSMQCHRLASYILSTRVRHRCSQICSRTLQTSAKQFSAKSRHAFEINSNIARDVVVYTYKNDRYYKLLTLFGIVQFFFWVNLAGFCYNDLPKVSARQQERRGEQAGSVANRVITAMEQYRYRIAVLCLTLGYVVLFFTWVYPQRSVASLSLLRGGAHVRLTTYSHFGRQRSFDAPLTNLSCMQTRTSKGANVALKVKSKWFYYLMDKKDGKFMEPDLFDFVVGLKRDLDN